MLNLLGVILLIVASLLLLWLLTIIGKVRSRIFRWGGAGILGLILVMTLLFSGAVTAGLIKLYGRGANLPMPAVEIDASQAARGEAISSSFCGDCHSRTGTLTGGKDFAA